MSSIRIDRDFDDDEIVIRIKRGTAAGSFARFLEASAIAIEHGKIVGRPGGNPVAVADELRKMVTKIQGHNA